MAAAGPGLAAASTEFGTTIEKRVQEGSGRYNGEDLYFGAVL